MNAGEQVTGWVLAHRIVLAYLVRAVRQAVPEEADRAAIDTTMAMMHNSLAGPLGKLPPDIAARIQAFGAGEIDNIMTAPFRDVPPAAPDRP